MVVTVSGLTLWVPMIRDLFRFGPLHGHDMLIAVGAGLILLLILEGAKALVRDRRSRSASAAAR
jgi:Ca2+-transporting ATPase